jgi:alkanesulfonate monooxygenase SsuD/methylene tetrahydromethanopterin reductase-like flavin-dependent oxidoreductase (luciferase family)
VAPEFWLFLPQLRQSSAAVLQRASAAEAAGFDGVALMDHLAPPFAEDAECLAAMSTAAFLLARTDRLRVGHLVLSGPSWHPAVLAKEAATLDEISGGRFELGLGWGSARAELRRFGVTTDAAPARAARLAEMLDIVTALLRGETVDHAGHYFRLDGARQRPVPKTALPIVVGGAGDLTLPLVRRYGTWWSCPTYAADRADELAPQVSPARLSVQHPIGFVRHGQDPAAVAATAQRRFGGWGGLVRGTSSRLVEFFRQRNAAGVERFYLAFSDFADPDTLAEFGQTVLAAFGDEKASGG